MTSAYQTPDHGRRAFARTNVETVRQRADIIEEILPNVQSITEVCCGDCYNQWEIYHQRFSLISFIGLDIDPEIVALNQARGINCVRGNAENKEAMKSLLSCEIVFFGPPLSVGCAGHRLIPFQTVIPGYDRFIRLMFGKLNYHGTIVCIGSKKTSMGDIRWLYDSLRSSRSDVGLRLAHYSYSNISGAGKKTQERLKYVELWLSTELEDSWEIRESRDTSAS